MMTKSKLRERVSKWTAPNLDLNAGHTYDRSWEEIQEMYLDARERCAAWHLALQKIQKEHGKNSVKQPEWRDALRNYHALRGVVKALKWVLDSEADHPLD